METATQALRELAPSVFDDRGLCFRLEKQRMIESIRSIQSNDTSNLLVAIQKTDLASSALTAYPEAFNELKRTLVGLVWKQNISLKVATGQAQTDEDGHTSKRQCKVPSKVDSEWSTDRRQELASVVHTSTLKALGIPDPHLPLLLRYLARFVREVACYF
jgi:hypothetical protein